MPIKKNFKLISTPKSHKPKRKLPKKLWKIMDIAIADVMSVIASNNATINFDDVCDVVRNGRCKVSLVGAVIVGSLGIDKKEQFVDDQYIMQMNGWDIYATDCLDDITRGSLGGVHDYFSKGRDCKFNGNIYSWYGHFMINDVYDSNLDKEEIDNFIGLFNRRTLKKRQEFYIDYLAQLRNYWKRENI